MAQTGIAESETISGAAPITKNLMKSQRLANIMIDPNLSSQGTGNAESEILTSGAAATSESTEEIRKKIS